MKKRMRKAVAIAATAAMVGSLPMGAVTAQAADDDITIGVSIWSSTDVLGSQSKKIIDKAADALGQNYRYMMCLCFMKHTLKVTPWRFSILPILA